MKCNRVLITGANGLLGSAVVETFRLNTGAQIVGVGRHELDISNAEHVASTLEGFRPDLVINCAAYTKVDDCEAHEDHARSVNADGAGHVACVAAAIGADLIHISTDYVFNGNAVAPIPEDTEPGAPEHLCAYGRTKRLGEELVRQNHPRAVIVRTAWLFGRDGASFPRTVLQWAQSGMPLRIVGDQTGSPTYVNDLALGLLELVQHDVKGTYHFTNEGSCTWHAYAGEVLRNAGIIANIETITSEQLGRPAKRPKFSVLDMTQFIAHTGHRSRPWQAALGEFLRE
ncbi:MAG TPA: dTDP-4-dehydrorhamnose reductase [Phycisphaerae bacterium]|nr:dTDP-4-dehydrorhamnose reductase [Phycisphaerae bacterium]